MKNFKKLLLISLCFLQSFVAESASRRFMSTAGASVSKLLTNPIGQPGSGLRRAAIREAVKRKTISGLAFLDRQGALAKKSEDDNVSKAYFAALRSFLNWHRKNHGLAREPESEILKSLYEKGLRPGDPEVDELHKKVTNRIRGYSNPSPSMIPGEKAIFSGSDGDIAYNKPDSEQCQIIMQALQSRASELAKLGVTPEKLADLVYIYNNSKTLNRIGFYSENKIFIQSDQLKNKLDLLSALLHEYQHYLYADGHKACSLDRMTYRFDEERRADMLSSDILNCSGCAQSLLKEVLKSDTPEGFGDLYKQGYVRYDIFASNDYHYKEGRRDSCEICENQAKVDKETAEQLDKIDKEIAVLRERVAALRETAAVLNYVNLGAILYLGSYIADMVYPGSISLPAVSMPDVADLNWR